MRLVDRGEQQLARLVHLHEPLDAARRDLLGREVEEGEGSLPRTPLHRGVELRGAEQRRHLAPLLVVGLGDLVLHERDERRDDDGRLAHVQCGQLVA